MIESPTQLVPEPEDAELIGLQRRIHGAIALTVSDSIFRISATSSNTNITFTTISLNGSNAAASRFSASFSL
jgi:hypothetical protein